MRRDRQRGLGSPFPESLIVKADYIASQFGLSVTDFERYRHRGFIVVSVERGSDEQAGISHVKCRLGNRVWNALVDAEGTVVHEETTFPRGKLARVNRGDD